MRFDLGCTLGTTGVRAGEKNDCNVLCLFFILTRRLFIADKQRKARLAQGTSSPCLERRNQESEAERGATYLQYAGCRDWAGARRRGARRPIARRARRASGRRLDAPRTRTGLPAGALPRWPLGERSADPGRLDEIGGQRTRVRDGRTARGAVAD